MSDTNEALDARIVALEETVAHQSLTIEELSGELAAQWKLMEQMRNKLEKLTERFLALEEQSLEAAPVTRPPHF